MLRKIRLLTAVSLAVLALTPLAFSAGVTLGRITLYETSLEKFGTLYFPFTFNFAVGGPQQKLWVLCENGVSPTGGCVNSNISDVVCITNDQAGSGVAAMMSDLETSLSLGNLPPDFPCLASAGGIRFVAETGKSQILSGKAGVPTTINGGPGPIIRVTAMSDLESSTSTTSDILTISTQ